jgi:hypothetical protein
LDIFCALQKQIVIQVADLLAVSFSAARTLLSKNKADRQLFYYFYFSKLNHPLS